jgi:hypothetical protein
LERQNGFGGDEVPAKRLGEDRLRELVGSRAGDGNAGFDGVG